MLETAWLAFDLVIKLAWQPVPMRRVVIMAIMVRSLFIIAFVCGYLYITKRQFYLQVVELTIHCQI